MHARTYTLVCMCMCVQRDNGGGLDGPVNRDPDTSESGICTTPLPRLQKAYYV